eukprot:6835576-Heterocapsa_arctica.AAC.1
MRLSSFTATYNVLNAHSSDISAYSCVVPHAATPITGYARSAAYRLWPLSLACSSPALASVRCA